MGAELVEVFSSFNEENDDADDIDDMDVDADEWAGELLVLLVLMIGGWGDGDGDADDDESYCLSKLRLLDDELVGVFSWLLFFFFFFFLFFFSGLDDDDEEDDEFEDSDDSEEHSEEFSSSRDCEVDRLRFMLLPLLLTVVISSRFSFTFSCWADCGGSRFSTATTLFWTLVVVVVVIVELLSFFFFSLSKSFLSRCFFSLAFVSSLLFVLLFVLSELLCFKSRFSFLRVNFLSLRLIFFVSISLISWFRSFWLLSSLVVLVVAVVMLAKWGGSWGPYISDCDWVLLESWWVDDVGRAGAGGFSLIIILGTKVGAVMVVLLFWLDKLFKEFK